MHSKQQNNTNYPSLLLNQSQNALVFSLLGKRCYTLATAVVQLVLTEPSSLSKWSLKTTGVVCFVKDHPKKSYFIKVYDCDKRTLTWQQEIYPSFEYRTPRPYFHTFEAHDCIVGLNFASEQEAQIFKETILGKLKDREKKRTDRMRPNGHHIDHPMKMSHNNFNSSNHKSNHEILNPTLNANNLANHNGSSPYIIDANNQTRLQHTISARLRPTQSGAAASIPVSAMQKSQSALLGNINNNLTSLPNFAMKSDKKKLNKRDIGLPTNFQHVTHVGFSPQTGFDLENVNPSMKKDLQKLFANPEQQQQHQQHQSQTNNSTRQQYNHNQSLQQQSHYQHQSNQSHLLLANQSATNAPAPPPPPPPPPVPPMPSPSIMNKQKPLSHSGASHVNSGGHLEKSPSNGLQVSQLPPPVPPPPPPPRPLPPMPSGASRPRTGASNSNQSRQIVEKPNTNGVTPSSAGAAAPPPPPPPPPPPMNLPPGPLGAPVSSLKPTTATAKSSPAPAPPNQMDMHAALMSQLLKGRQLNHVDPEKKSQQQANSLAAQDDPRTALMNQIKAGVKLKTVSSNQTKPAAVAAPIAATGLAGALAKALQERSKVLQQTDESQSSSSEDDDDDEWDES